MDKPVAGYYRVSVYRDGSIGPEWVPSSVGLLATRFARRTRCALVALGAATSDG